MSKIQKLLVLTSGGDAPGMNAAIRAVVRSANHHSIDIFGCYGGYHGLIKQDIVPLDADSVANCIQRGGTILRTRRCKEFFEKDVRADCIKLLKNKKIDAIVVIGGDGSFRGASLLEEEGGPKVIGIPATIDNDIVGTDYTIGFDTASNTALQAIDKIRDTASSHERQFLVEVMGRHAGFLALNVGIAGGAELIITPEFPISSEEIAEKLKRPRRKKMSTIIVVAEAGPTPGKSIKIARELEKLIDLNFKFCILGHTQRGGSPTVYDRRIATQMGDLAVCSLMAGKSSCMTAVENAQLKLMPFPNPAAEARRLSDRDLIQLSEILAI